MIVVDSNVLAARTLLCERSSRAIQIESLDNVWLVPRLWRYEFLNILATQIKTGRITPPKAHLLFDELRHLLSDNEHDPGADAVLALVARNRITAYDAHFVALAQTYRCELVTEDAELLSKFPGLASSMDSFIARHSPTDGVRETPAPYLTRKRSSPRPTRTAPPQPLNPSTLIRP